MLLAVVFFAATVSKMRGRRDRAEFRASLGAFGVKPRWRPAVAAAVITCELDTAVLAAGSRHRARGSGCRGGVDRLHDGDQLGSAAGYVGELPVFRRVDAAGGQAAPGA